jgi:alpha-amylase
MLSYLLKANERSFQDRRVDISLPYNIKAWTKFLYAARAGKYSTFTYNKSHFNGTDWNEKNKKRAIYRFVEDGKDWMQDVGKLQGNADYLMLENLDYTNAEVVQETTEWGEWIVDELDLKGFRLDAIQHYSWGFANKWTKHLKDTFAEDKELLFVGEFWHGDVRMLTSWLDNMHPFFRLYDVPLMYNIAKLSQFETKDLRQVFEGSLVKARPSQAVVGKSCPPKYPAY